MSSSIKNNTPCSIKPTENAVVILALTLTIFFRSLVFVFAKYAALDTSDKAFISIFINYWYWAELAALAMQAIFWVYVLKKLSLNIAYPAMATIYAVNLTWAWYLFDEAISPLHIIGCCLIITGVAMATLSSQSKTKCQIS